MRKRLWLQLTLFALVVIGVPLFAWRSLGSEEQAVYSAVVDNAIRGPSKMTAVAISHPSDCSAATKIDGVSDSLLAEFREANGSSARPVRLYALEERVPVVAWEVNQQFFSQPRLLLGKLEGRTLLALSRVVLSEDGNTALLCVESLGKELSKGSLALYARTDQGWVLMKMIPTWIT